MYFGVLRFSRLSDISVYTLSKLIQNVEVNDGCHPLFFIYTINFCLFLKRQIRSNKGHILKGHPLGYYKKHISNKQCIADIDSGKWAAFCGLVRILRPWSRVPVFKVYKAISVSMENRKITNCIVLSTIPTLHYLTLVGFFVSMILKMCTEKILCYRTVFFR